MNVRWLALGALGLVAFAAVVPSFTINGKKVTLQTLERGGKIYVEAEAFAKALGAKVTYNKTTGQFVITTSPAAPVAQQPVTQGTTQLAGGAGELGKTYTLGKDDPVNFTLKSAEYSVGRVTMGGNIYAPKAGEKLLILRYTVQNPQKRDLALNYATLKFTVVDARDVNHVFDSYIVREGSPEILDVQLKPAQKIDVVIVQAVPAKGEIPKLIVQRGSGSNAPVVRYDLRGKVKPLAAPFADPADKTGATALEQVPAQMGVYYPLLEFDLKLDSVTFSKDPILESTPREGMHFLVATFTARYGVAATANPRSYSYANFTFELVDSDGEKVKFDDYLAKVSRNERAEGQLKPGEEARFRVFFAVPEGTTGKTLLVSEGESRVYAIDISSAK